MKLIPLAKSGFQVWFFLGTVLVAPAVPVTFQVDMSVQTELGNFDPAVHSVEVHGSFDGWGAGMTLSVSPTNASVYEGTIDATGAPGSTVEYKFVNNQNGTLVWENNGVGPDGAQNRELSIPDSAQTLPVVYFNNEATPPGVVPVTFQVKLEIQQAIGNFDPAMHTVEAHGSFDAWGAGITLSANATNADLYEGTVNVTGAAGAPFEYKFVINQAGTLLWEGNVGPGGPFGNRTFTLAETAQTLPPVFFNNLTNDPGAGIPVTFQVNLSVQTARGLFDPAAGTVTVAGQFNTWSPTASPLTNNPSDPYLYTGMVNITTVAAGGVVPYKFVINGGTWEGGDDREFTLASSSQTLPVEFFDRVNDLGLIAVALDAPIGGQKLLSVSWAGGPRIRLQSTTDLYTSWQEVAGSLGESMIMLDLTFEEIPGPTFFRLVGP
jgi:hypothetical protein